MLQDDSEVELQVEVAVLKTKIEHIDESIHSLKRQLDDIETRLVRVERITYMVLGGLVILQVLPSIQSFLGV
jgi:chaperonin cofactor prefoldin